MINKRGGFSWFSLVGMHGSPLCHNSSVCGIALALPKAVRGECWVVWYHRGEDGVTRSPPRLVDLPPPLLCDIKMLTAAGKWLPTSAPNLTAVETTPPIYSILSSHRLSAISTMLPWNRYEFLCEVRYERHPSYSLLFWDYWPARSTGRGYITR